MELYDQHLHSNHSVDSKADPSDNVRAAIASGLAGLTFTEHFDTHPSDWKTCTYDESAYAATIARLRSEFGDAIFIGRGIEVCYQPDRMPFILEFLTRHRFDMVILSVHYFADAPLHNRNSWSGLSVHEGTKRYLETVLSAARYCEQLHATAGRVFDVLGHLDLVKRYTQRFFGTHDVSSFGDLIDDILSACLEADLTPELNTSTLRQGLTEPMPALGTIRRYVALGGTTVSLGSDAHRSQDIGAGFDDALSILRQAGVDTLAVFEQRTIRRIPLL